MKAELELLGPGPLHLDGHLDGPGQHRGLQLHRANGLAAKGAAYALAVHDNLLCVEPQALDHHVALEEHVLRADPELQVSLGVELRHGSPGLDWRVRCQRHIESQIHVPNTLGIDLVVMHLM